MCGSFKNAVSHGVWTLFPSRNKGGGSRFQNDSNGLPVRSAWYVANSQAKSPPTGGVFWILVWSSVTLSPMLKVYPRIVTGCQSWTVSSFSNRPIGIPSMVTGLPSSSVTPSSFSITSASSFFLGSYVSVG